MSQMTAEEIVAQLRGVSVPASEDFFTEVLARLRDKEWGLDRIMAKDYEIVTLVCHAWIEGNKLEGGNLPPHLDLWPFIAAITPANMRSSAQQFWAKVCVAAIEYAAGQP